MKQADFEPEPSYASIDLLLAKDIVSIAYINPYYEYCLHKSLLCDTVSSSMSKIKAATGATTGDWLVQFFREDCEECARQRATLEGLACRLKGRINVAMVDKGSRGAATGRRFAAGKPPAYIL